MERTGSIHEKIQAYYGSMADEHDRYRSWEHCYRYFRRATPAMLKADRDNAALQLGFYLASWGMYRGSSFLLKHAYTIHRGVIDLLASPEFAALREHEFGSTESSVKLLPSIIEGINAIREAYRPFAPASEDRQASDTLVTKILLGTFGCLPACDRFFIRGFKHMGFKYSYLNNTFIERVLLFSSERATELHEEQELIEKAGGLRYPLMKLVDMYFWQIGFELDNNRKQVAG